MLNNYIYKRCAAYTLSELLVTLSIVGVVAAITLPTLRSAMPDKYDAMRKKAEYELEQKLTELANDDILYGDRYDKNNNKITGFKNTYYVKVDGESYGSDSSEGNGATYQKQKFCKLLASKFDLATESTCDLETTKFSSSSEEEKGPNFVTRDGIEWILEVTNFDNNPAIIAFRVSAGDSRAPKCAYNPQDNGEDDEPPKSDTSLETLISKFAETRSITYAHNNCDHPDTFIYAIYPNGVLYKPYERDYKVKVRN